MACEIEHLGPDLRVAGGMTMYEINELAAVLLATARTQSGPVRMDLSDVSEIDTAGLQLLLVMRRASMACGGRFVLVSAGSAVREALDLCGLTELMVPAPDAQAFP